MRLRTAQGRLKVKHSIIDGVRDLLERLLAVLGDLHLVSSKRQRATEGVTHGAVIVDDEDPHRPDSCVRSTAARPWQS